MLQICIINGNPFFEVFPDISIRSYSEIDGKNNFRSCSGALVYVPAGMVHEVKVVLHLQERDERRDDLPDGEPGQGVLCSELIP